MPAPSERSVSTRGAAMFLSLAVSVTVALELRAVQFASPHMISRDGYYHTRYAHLLPQRGLSRSFPWMQHSFWKDRFADKELLFHVWLAPFCRDEARLASGGKFAAWLLAGLAVLAFALAVRSSGIPMAPLWALVLVSAGSHFLFRLSECRAHVFSIVFFIAGLALLLKGRWKWLVPLGFLYSWSYAAPHFLVALAVAHALALAVHEKRFEWRGVAFSAAGVAAGLLVHPYFPNNIRLWWVQNAVVLWRAWAGGGDFHLGDEFQSIHPRSLVASSTVVFLGLVAGSVLCTVAARAQRLSARTFALLLVTLGTFTLYCLSARFIEYFAPAAVWLLASVASDLVDGARLRELWERRRGATTWAAAGLLVALAVLHVRSVERSIAEVRKTRGPVLSKAAAWTRAHVPRDANVVHLNWGDFVQLFHFDPDHRYINGLDPSFMYSVDPSRLRYLEEVRRGKEPVVKEDLAAVFGSETLVVSKEYPWQVRACEDALLEVLYEDENAVVYSLK